MKISSTEVPPRQVVVDIEVDQDRFNSAVDQALRRASARVNVPGFRKGKAPRAMVERMVGRSALVDEAVERLAPDVVQEALREENVTAFARPHVEIVDLEPLRLKATVPLSPVVELGDYEHGLAVSAEDVAIQPAQVDEVVERILESHAQWVPVERAVRQGDRVGIDVRGEVVETGRVLLDSHDAEYLVDPEGQQPAPGFADALLGLVAGGEKAFTLALPDDYRDPSIAGKAVAFSVRLHWAKEKELPELDDAFAQQVGDYQDLAAVRAAIGEQLREREEERVRREAEVAVLDRLVEISRIEVAPQMVEYEAQHMLDELRQSVERQRLTFDQYLRLVGKDPESLQKDMLPQAEKRLKRALALRAFTEAQSIEVGEAEVDAEMERYEAATSERAEAAPADARSRIESGLRERKVLDRLLTRAGLEKLLSGPPGVHTAGVSTASVQSEESGALGDPEPAVKVS